MKISLLFIVVVFNHYAETTVFEYERPREIFSNSQGSPDLRVSVSLPRVEYLFAEREYRMVSLKCTPSTFDGEIWWVKDEVKLTEPVQAEHDFEDETIWDIELNEKDDAGDFTCVAKMENGTILNKTVHIGKIEPARITSSPIRIHDVLVNESVTLTCDVEGYPLPILYWDTHFTAHAARWKDITKLTYINETYARMSIDFRSVQHADQATYCCAAVHPIVSKQVRSCNYLRVNDEPAIEWELVVAVGVDKLHFEIPNTIDIDKMIDPFFEYRKNYTEEWRVHTGIEKIRRDRYVVSGLESRAWYKFRITFLNDHGVFGPVYYKWMKPLEEEKGTEVLIWSSLTVAVVLFIIVGTWIIIQQRRQKTARWKMSRAVFQRFNAGALDSLNPELNITDQAELLPYNKEWEFPRELLKLDRVLQSGAFGIVRKAQAQSILRPDTVTTVAVKLVRATARLNHMTALDRELKILGYLGKHLNVVNLLGACTQNINYGELLVIVEFCRFGNLRDYLIRRRDDFISQIDTTSAVTITANSNASVDTSDNTQNFTYENQQVVDSAPVTDAIEPVRRSNYKGDYTDEDLQPIETRDLICWTWQVSRGMKFLGSRRVIHGDLAARNILLADHNVVKICDFGMAKALQADEDYKKKGHDPLPVKWMAIESLRDRVFSYQSDIWSFGIVLWEFFTLGATPYPGIDPGSLYQRLKDGFRMECPKYATPEIYCMMQFCWDAEPTKRPSFEQLENNLANFLDENVKTHYMNLSLPYVQMNDDALNHGETDYLIMTP